MPSFVQFYRVIATVAWT